MTPTQDDLADVSHQLLELRQEYHSDKKLLKGAAIVFVVLLGAFFGISLSQIATHVKNAMQEQVGRDVLDAIGQAKKDADWLEEAAKQAGTLVVPGAILPFAGEELPDGWLEADGRPITPEECPLLYQVLVSTYGNGNLPDLRGRVPVGLDGGDPLFDQLGRQSGESTHELTEEEMPAHTHQLVEGGMKVTLLGNEQSNLFDYSREGGAISREPTYDVKHTQDSGGGAAHNNLQPFLVVRYLIKC